MFCFRTKTKVRYAILLCSLSALGVYAFAQLTGCCGNLLRSAPGQVARNTGPELIRNTFTAKWHDSRELLNDLSESQERARVQARFLRHLGRKQPFKALKTVEEISLYNEARNEVEMKESEVEIKKNIDQQNNDVAVLDAATESYLATMAAEFEEGRTVKEDEYRSEKEDQNRPDQAIRLASLRRGLEKQNRFPDRQPMEINYGDTHAENELERHEQRSRGAVRQHRAEKTSQLKTREANYVGNQKGDAENGAEPLAREPDRRKQDNHAASDLGYVRNEGREKLSRIARDHLREQPLADVDYSKMQRLNRTIFHPADSEIEYQPSFSEATLINKSRLAEANRASDFPMTPEVAVALYKEQLPPWERFEIFHYPKIYYLGLRAQKTQLTSNETNNFGFDKDAGTHDEGYYKVVEGDHIGYRYEILKFLGSGTFGSVVLARDWSNPAANNVALKIMHYDEDLKYIVREFEMNNLLETKATSMDYFPRMIATFQFRNHHCMVMELLGRSLHRRHISPVRNMTTFRRYARDILLGLQVLSELNIVHGDMKPDNIMLIHGKNNRSEGQLLKIADFGIGCVPGNKKVFKCPAYYLQTRYYRAPEVILSLSIGPHVDMFSVGVIFAEFYIGKPPFFGESEVDQFASIMEVLGLPPTFMIARSPRRKVFSRAMCYETENGFHRKPFRKPLTKMLKGMDPGLFDLVARCLEFDPKHRITPQQALKHPFITGVYPPNGFPKPLSIKRLEGEI